MAFVNLSLLLGGLLIAVPIVLHLVMRQKPKHLLFPAMRFIQQRRETNQRRLQLRHWLLLLLRCGAIAVLAATLARPSVSSALLGNWIIIGVAASMLLLVIALAVAMVVLRRGWLVAAGFGGLALGLLASLVLMVVHTIGHDVGAPIGDQEAPVAAVLVLDTSPRMTYRNQNRTRIAQAQETAIWLIKQLPLDSEVAIADSRLGGLVFAADVGAAVKSVEGLEPTNVPEPLLDILDAALELTRKTEKARKEVYVFTDMAEAQWTGHHADLASRLETHNDVALYVVDVGAESPQNTALGEIRLSSQQLSRNRTLRIDSELRCLGPGGERVIELHLVQPDAGQPMLVDGRLQEPKSRRADRAVFSVQEDSAQTIQFRPRLQQLGTYHGWIQILGQDGLRADDTRYFTVEVTDAWPILVVAGPGAQSLFLTEALAPEEFRKAGRARFHCTVIEGKQLASQPLDDFAAVCLLDPTPLTPATWRTLEDYVQRGGGLAVWLGHNARPAKELNDQAPQALLPGKLVRQWKAGQRDFYVALDNTDHPVLRGFRAVETAIPWRQFPVTRHWGLGPLYAGSRVLLRYSNNQPALIQRSVGRGHVLTMTTPVSDPTNLKGRDPWNLLPTGFGPWPFVMLSNEMMLHLVSGGQGRLNYLVGEPATLPIDPESDPDRYLLYMPHGGWEDVRATFGRVTVGFTELPGSYRLTSEDADVRRGFSVNLDSTATDLTRCGRQQLDEILGEERYSFARNREEIVRDQGEARMGREFYSFLILLLALLMAMEYPFASRFYRRVDGAQEHSVKPTRWNKGTMTSEDTERDSAKEAPADSDATTSAEGEYETRQREQPISSGPPSRPRSTTHDETAQ